MYEREKATCLDFPLFDILSKIKNLENGIFLISSIPKNCNYLPLIGDKI